MIPYLVVISSRPRPPFFPFPRVTDASHHGKISDKVGAPLSRSRRPSLRSLKKTCPRAGLSKRTLRKTWGLLSRIVLSLIYFIKTAIRSFSAFFLPFFLERTILMKSLLTLLLLHITPLLSDIQLKPRKELQFAH